MNADELKEILAQHKQWLETNGSDGKCADLRGADLRGADLLGANLYGANLRRADLRGADLRGADLRGADIDYSSWPLWCGSLDVKIDARIAAQLMYHTLRAMRSCAHDDDVAEVLRNHDVIRLANRFHRVEGCGMIKGGAA